MDGVAFELANLVSILVHVGEQSASGFAVEADGRDEGVAPRDFAGPFLAVPFDPVIPDFGRRVLADAPVGVDDFG